MFNLKSSKSLFIFLILFTIFLGGFIYILFRPSEPVFFRWLAGIGLGDWVISTRQKSLSFSNTFPEWVVFSLPNGLWAFAYSLFITGFWWRSKSRLKYFWMTTIPVLVLGFEFLQLLKITSGTFCTQDIFFGLLGITIGFIAGINISLFIPQKLDTHI